MNVLAIDTSTKNLVVALVRDGELVRCCNYSEQMRHAEHLVRIVDTVLKKSKTTVSEIDTFACGLGPGSYTGLRIGHAFVKGLCVAQESRVKSFSSMQLIAHNVLQETLGKIAVVLDARRDKFYFSLFENSGEQLCVVEEHLVLDLRGVKERLQKDEDVVVTGDALNKYYDEFVGAVKAKKQLCAEKQWYPRAEKMTDLLCNNHVKAVSAEALMPLYLRPST